LSARTSKTGRAFDSNFLQTKEDLAIPQKEKFVRYPRLKKVDCQKRLSDCSLHTFNATNANGFAHR
jgi:hypothetical protein